LKRLLSILNTAQRFHYRNEISGEFQSEKVRQVQEAHPVSDPYFQSAITVSC